MKIKKIFLTITVLSLYLNTFSQTSNGIYAWEGTINNKIPVFLWATTRGDVLFGEIVYKNIGKPIKLRGTIEKDNSFRVFEFEPSGNITGIITGMQENNNFNGEWFSPKTRDEFKLILKLKDTSLTAIDTTTTAKKYSGIYTYGFSDAGHQGYLKVTKLRADDYTFEINNVTEAPGRNMATAGPDTVTIKNNQFIYKSDYSANCEYKIRIFKDIVVINYIDDKTDCGFGHNATVDGVYLKTKE